MMKLLALTLTLALTGWSSASACSPVPATVTTDKSYEERIAPYLLKKHRNRVDQSDNIFIGKFKYSKRKKAHRFSISEVLKNDPTEKTKKRISVKFHQIHDDRVTYDAFNKTAERLSRNTDWFNPSIFTHGIQGSFGPGDCGISLDILKGQNYLIFADKNFKITSMLHVQENNLTYITAIKNMVDDPNEPFGVSRTFKQMLDEENKLKLIQTEFCESLPIYKILKSSTAGEEGETFKSNSIMVFEELEGRSFSELTENDFNRARDLGLKTGLYTNAPKLSDCKIGQKYLLLPAGYRQHQMIAEQEGVFSLRETAFEHNIIPKEITYSQISKLLDEKGE